jgi:hypothetical protein
LEFDDGNKHKMKRGTEHMNHQLNDMKRRLVLTAWAVLGLRLPAPDSSERHSAHRRLKD